MIYVRIKRDDGWQHLPIEQLTDSERELFFCRKSPEELVRWINGLCKELRESRGDAV